MKVFGLVGVSHCSSLASSREGVHRVHKGEWIVMYVTVYCCIFLKNSKKSHIQFSSALQNLLSLVHLDTRFTHNLPSADDPCRILQWFQWSSETGWLFLELRQEWTLRSSCIHRGLGEAGATRKTQKLIICTVFCCRGWFTIQSQHTVRWQRHRVGFGELASQSHHPIVWHVQTPHAAPSLRRLGTFCHGNWSSRTRSSEGEAVISIRFTFFFFFLRSS